MTKRGGVFLVGWLGGATLTTHRFPANKLVFALRFFFFLKKKCKTIRISKKNLLGWVFAGEMEILSNTFSSSFFFIL